MNEESVRWLRSHDSVWDNLIERIGPIELRPKMQPPFNALVHAVIHQQLSGAAAKTILGRFVALFGGNVFPCPEEVLSLGLDRLREVGLSRPKASYVLDVASRAADGRLPNLAEMLTLPDCEILRRLTEVKGVGAWTAEMVLIFNLGRPDVLPISDLGIQKGFYRVFKRRKLPSPEQLFRFGKKWSPHRTTAAWYLWRVADLTDAQWSDWLAQGES